MALKVTDSIKNSNYENAKWRQFDSIYGTVTPDRWIFKYITKNTAGGEWRLGDDVEFDKSKYSSDTIFFDSTADHNGDVILSSTVENVVIDTDPPKLIKEDVQYTTFSSNHKCSFTFESKVLLDIAQLAILNGNTDADILFYCCRKGQDVEPNEAITDITVIKNNNNYTLSFYIDENYGDEKLNSDQITVVVWDIAGNKTIYTTNNIWKTIQDKDAADMQRLIIDFVEIEPSTRIVQSNVEGKVLVRVTNPNKDLWGIIPTVGLFNNSIGYIEEASKVYHLDEEGNPIGVLTFYVTHINSNGFLNVEAWIDVNNDDVRDVIKNATYNTRSLGPFICTEEGRKYKLMGYAPKYLNDELYYNFVRFVQDFLNTSQKSLSTGNAISTLEKTARISNFSDPFRIETPLLSYYKKQFNIEVDPKLEDYVYFLNHREVNTENNND